MCVNPLLSMCGFTSSLDCSHGMLLTKGHDVEPHPHLSVAQLVAASRLKALLTTQGFIANLSCVLLELLKSPALGVKGSCCELKL